MHYAYILKSEKDPTVLYHGFTSDIRERLAAHNPKEENRTADGRRFTQIIKELCQFTGSPAGLAWDFIQTS